MQTMCGTVMAASGSQKYVRDITGGSAISEAEIHAEITGLWREGNDTRRCSGDTIAKCESLREPAVNRDKDPGE